jgi:hypothetical protein
MRGAWLTRGAVGLVLLFGGPSVCLADGKYDRKLERAAAEIVARKMGDIRGSLKREWTPPQGIYAPQVPAEQMTATVSDGSFVSINPPAVATSAAQAAKRVSRVISN